MRSRAQVVFEFLGLLDAARNFLYNGPQAVHRDRRELVSGFVALKRKAAVAVQVHLHVGPNRDDQTECAGDARF